MARAKVLFLDFYWWFKCKHNDSKSSHVVKGSKQDSNRLDGHINRAKFVKKSIKSNKSNVTKPVNTKVAIVNKHIIFVTIKSPLSCIIDSVCIITNQCH